MAWGQVGPLAAAAAAHLAPSDPERRRLQALRSAGRRAQFLAGHWLARTLIARVHGGAPGDWTLDAGEGPPNVMAPASPICIALSHSAGIVGCAIGDSPIGIDVEAPRRPRDVLSLAQLACDDDERAALAACDPGQREALFYTFWTAKEAWLKRNCDAMTPHRMARIHLRPAPDFDLASVRVWNAQEWRLALAARAPSRIAWHAPALEPASAWQVRDDDNGEGATRPA